MVLITNNNNEPSMYSGMRLDGYERGESLAAWIALEDSDVSLYLLC